MIRSNLRCLGSNTVVDAVPKGLQRDPFGHNEDFGHSILVAMSDSGI
jgi:hypothetical protein